MNYVVKFLTDSGRFFKAGEYAATSRGETSTPDLQKAYVFNSRMSRGVAFEESEVRRIEVELVLKP